MGLDSVELVMEWEEYFNIKIPDLEASKIGTIAHAVNYISTQVEYSNHKTDIKEEIFDKLNNAFLISNLAISPNYFVFEVLSIQEEQHWIDISKRIEYEIPLPFSASKLGKWYDKLFPLKLNFSELSFDRYVDLICAVNYRKLIQQGEFRNQYEVMVAVMGITIDKIGVSPFEVFWNSSFTNDLGID